MKLKLWNHLSTLDHYVVFLLDLDYSSWPRVKRLSQESRTGTRNTGPIVNSSETLSFDPSSPVSNRVVQCGGAALAVPSHSHCPRITSSWGARIQPPLSLFPSVHGCFWVFYASGELYLRGEWSLTWINCISLPAASPFADSSTDDSWWSNQRIEMHECPGHFFFLCFCDYVRLIFRVPLIFPTLVGFQDWIGLRFLQSKGFFFVPLIGGRFAEIECCWRIERAALSNVE